MNISRILVAVDESDFSIKTAEAAYGLAKTSNASLCLMSVVDPAIVAVGADSVVYPIEQLGSLKENAEAVIAKIKGCLGTDVTIEEYIGEGKPSDEIINQAAAWKANLIIMGTHGRTGLMHMILGSVAENVIRHATIPVMVIPSKTA